VNEVEKTQTRGVALVLLALVAFAVFRLVAR
jgi:hypothetical protein